MEFKKVSILGVGAVGSYILWGLSKREDIEVNVIADGERKERYTRDGFVINGETYHPEIKTPEEAAGTDLLVVCLKYNALRLALEEIKTIVGENTTVISLMNGVDSEEIIAEAVGMDKLIHSVIWISSERKDNSVNFNPLTTGGIICGEADSKAAPDRMNAVRELFDGTGIHYRVTDVILSEIWKKFRLNAANNQAQAILGVGFGAYRDSEHADFIRNKLGEEVDMIAAAKGIDISLAATDGAAKTPALDKARFSTLQDLDAKRPTEVDMFAGTIVRMGKELGIETPWNEFAYHATKALEEKNEGKFDY